MLYISARKNTKKIIEKTITESYKIVFLQCQKDNNKTTQNNTTMNKISERYARNMLVLIASTLASFLMCILAGAMEWEKVSTFFGGLTISCFVLSFIGCTIMLIKILLSFKDGQE